MDINERLNNWQQTITMLHSSNDANISTDRKSTTIITILNIIRQLLIIDESTTSLIERCFYSIDCLQRRLIVDLSYSIVIRLFDLSSFGHIKTDQIGIDFARTIISLFDRFDPHIYSCKGNYLLYLLIKSIFERHWFGGHIRSSIDEQSPIQRNNIKCIAMLIIASAIITTDNVTTIDSNIADNLIKFVQIYDSDSSLITHLIDHDERCLNVLTALLLLQKIKIPEQFNPLGLFCQLLVAIAFDHQVIIDWLHSELIAGPFLLRFVKLIGADLCAYRLHCINTQTHTHKRSRQITIDNRHHPIENVTTDNDIVVNIVEKVGDQRRTKSIGLCRSTDFENIYTNQSTIVDYHNRHSTMTIDDCHINIFDASFDCLIRLRLQLQRLSNANLAPFNVSTIIDAIEWLETVYEVEQQ